MEIDLYKKIDGPGGGKKIEKKREKGTEEGLHEMGR